MANSDDRKSTETTVGKDKAPRVAAEPTAKSVAAPVAVKGDEDSAKAGSTEDKLAAAVKAKGVDKVECWDGGDNKLYYVRMTKDGVTRQLSVTYAEAEDVSQAAKDVVAKANF